MEEPVFVLRAQDIHAPEIIIAWVQKVTQNPDSTRINFAKAAAAFKVAMEMLEWQQLNPRKVKIPDLHEAKPRRVPQKPVKKRQRTNKPPAPPEVLAKIQNNRKNLNWLDAA